MDPTQLLANAQSNDGSPSSGQGTSAPAPAQGTAGSDFSLEQLSRLIDAKLTDQRNGIFADLRKAGALGKAPKADADTPNPTQSPAADDVQTLIARERAFNRAISSVRLNDTQFARMERAFQLEKPDDPAAWVRDWTADLGIGKQETGPSASNPAAAPRSAHPVSDSGAPAPVTTPSDEVDPWTLSEDDLRAMYRRDGFQATTIKLRQQYRKALGGGRRLRLRG